MGLSERIQDAKPNFVPQGCVTCKWLDTVTPADRAAIDRWITEGKSKSQLWELCTTDPDNPLDISLSGFRLHLRHHDT